MKFYTFEKALELASEGLEPIFTRDEEHIIGLISIFNISELNDSIKNKITYIASNFSIDEFDKLLYSENGVALMRKALEQDIAMKQEDDEFNFRREIYIITTNTSHNKKAGVLNPCF